VGPRSRFEETGRGWGFGKRLERGGGETGAVLWRAVRTQFVGQFWVLPGLEVEGDAKDLARAWSCGGGGKGCRGESSEGVSRGAKAGARRGRRAGA